MTIMRPAPLDTRDLDRVLEPFGLSRTLPGAAYTSADVFEWEMESIFRSTWTCIGRLDELISPGQVRAANVAGEGVLFARDEAGALTAFANVCRHRGHELAPIGDAIDAKSIRCPYHAWSYRFDGSLRAAPTFVQTSGFEMADYPLIPLAAVEYGGWVWVDLSGQADPIEDHFGNLKNLMKPYETERLVTAASHSYTIESNWKVIIENYNECYHCSSIHPELCEVTPVDSGLDYQPSGMWCGGTMELKRHAVTMSLDGASHGIRFRNVDDRLARKVWYLTVVPNLLLSMHPDYVMTHVLTPLAPNRTQVVCSWLFPPEAFELEGFDPSYAVDFWDITNREDWTACESVMRGLASLGYRPGPLSSWEGTVYQFLSIIGNLYLGNGHVVPSVPDRGRR